MIFQPYPTSCTITSKQRLTNLENSNLLIYDANRGRGPGAGHSKCFKCAPEHPVNSSGGASAVPLGVAMEATVMKWLDDKGYGFLRLGASGTKDHFCHQSVRYRCFFWPKPICTRINN